MKIPSNRTVFYHWRDGFNATLAFTALPYENETEHIVIGWAFCSRKDNFNKKKGRMIAEGRMSVVGYNMNLVGVSSYRELAAKAIAQLLFLGEVPRALDKAVRRVLPVA